MGDENSILLHTHTLYPTPSYIPISLFWLLTEYITTTMPMLFIAEPDHVLWFPFFEWLTFFSRINKHLKNPCLVSYFADVSLIRLQTSSLHSRALSHVHASGNVSLFWRLLSSCAHLAWNKLVILGLPFTSSLTFPFGLIFCNFFCSCGFMITLFMYFLFYEG